MTSATNDTGNNYRLETRLVHHGEEPNFAPGGSGDVVMPIHLATTFARREVTEPTAGYEYARSANPTRDAVEARLATLEQAKHALACASGVAAETLVLLALLRSGDHVVAFDDLYGGSRRLFSQVFAERFNLTFSFVDARDPEGVRAAIKENTRLIWLETPTNPLLKLCDIAAISTIAHEHNALVVVDNTFATPYFQQPLALGADIVVHSTTKYLGGHSDSVGGTVILNDDALYERLAFTHNSTGAVLSPFDSYLLLRGIKTLAVRMRAIEKNAQQIAEHLAAHSAVRHTLYPGLDTHPQAELARQQMSGMGGMITFFIHGGQAEARRLFSNLRLFAVAESLGAVESLIEHPALMTHASVPAAEREKLGIDDSLIRISVGIEHSADLIADLERGLAAI